MPRLFARPAVLCATLLFLTAIPILISGVRLYQIPTGSLPPESLRFAEVPVRMFAHALAGLTFGLLGPLQFTRVLQRRFGRLHRVLGRVFAVAGLFLGAAGLGLMLQFPDAASPLLNGARTLASLALILALALGVRAAMLRDIASHKAWMIRAYAVGMGAATVALVMFPIFLITGQPPTGLLSDLCFVGSWAVNIAVGEWVIRATSGHPMGINTRPVRALP